MAKTFYNCPLCKKQTAYISEYGMQDSVICKCQGLNEVGRLVNGQYQPHINTQDKGTLSNGQPIVPPIQKRSAILGGQGYGSQPSLPQGQAQPNLAGQSMGIQTANFMVYHLALENEIEAAGKFFNNALQAQGPRQSYMQRGDIYYAECADENRSIMFFIDKGTKHALNFVGKNNAHVSAQDESEVKTALRQQGLITN